MVRQSPFTRFKAVNGDLAFLRVLRGCQNRRLVAVGLGGRDVGFEAICLQRALKVVCHLCGSVSGAGQIGPPMASLLRFRPPAGIALRGRPAPSSGAAWHQGRIRTPSAPKCPRSLFHSWKWSLPTGPAKSRTRFSPSRLDFEKGCRRQRARSGSRLGHRSPFRDDQAGCTALGRNRRSDRKNSWRRKGRGGYVLNRVLDVMQLSCRRDGRRSFRQPSCDRGKLSLR